MRKLLMMSALVLFAVFASAAEVKIVNRRGIEFTQVTTGNTKANLMGLATRRVQQRIDIELKKAVRPGFWQPNNASPPDAP